MRVVVTGATGFVGVNVARELAVSGHDVVGIDVVPPDELARGFLAGVSGRITAVTADLTDDAWPATLAGMPADAVVHAAAMTPLGAAEGRQAARAAEVNVVGIARILRWAAVAGVGRVVHISTGSVYGPVDDKDPVDEAVDHRPEDVYGITKSAGERLARRLAELEGLDLAVARLSHVYGPMERPSFARELVSPVERWTRALVEGEPIEPPRADATRDFVHVTDVARAIRLLVERDDAGIDVFNVSSGTLTSEAELVELLREIDPALAIGESTERRASSPRRPPLAIDRIRRAVGWRPEIALAGGLRSYVAWRRASGG